MTILSSLNSYWESKGGVEKKTAPASDDKLRVFEQSEQITQKLTIARAKFKDPTRAKEAVKDFRKSFLKISSNRLIIQAQLDLQPRLLAEILETLTKANETLDALLKSESVNHAFELNTITRQLKQLEKQLVDMAAKNAFPLTETDAYGTTYERTCIWVSLGKQRWVIELPDSKTKKTKVEHPLSIKGWPAEGKDRSVYDDRCLSFWGWNDTLSAELIEKTFNQTVLNVVNPSLKVTYKGEDRYLLDQVSHDLCRTKKIKINDVTVYDLNHQEAAHDELSSSEKTKAVYLKCAEAYGKDLVALENIMKFTTQESSACPLNFISSRFINMNLAILMEEDGYSVTIQQPKRDWDELIIDSVWQVKDLTQQGIQLPENATKELKSKDKFIKTSLHLKIWRPELTTKKFEHSKSWMTTSPLLADITEAEKYVPSGVHYIRTYTRG